MHCLLLNCGVAVVFSSWLVAFIAYIFGVHSWHILFAPATPFSLLIPVLCTIQFHYESREFYFCTCNSLMQGNRITTLGSETSGGSVYILNLVEPVDFDSSSAIGEMMHKTADFNCTIWTADCSYNSNRAVIGKYSSLFFFFLFFFFFSFHFSVSVLKLTWICIMCTALDLGYRTLLETCILEFCMLLDLVCFFCLLDWCFEKIIKNLPGPVCRLPLGC
jgi:hypothetical protein